MRLMWFAYLLLLVGACSLPRRPTSNAPYRFRQSLIDPPEARSPRTSRARKRRSRPSWRPQIIRRALARVGQRSDETPCRWVGDLFRTNRACEQLTLSWNRPDPGDLVIFDDAENVGVVVATESTVVRFVYLNGPYFRRGILDVGRPTRRRNAAGIVNSYVRVKHADDPPQTRYLAGELVSGFATLRPR